MALDKIDLKLLSKLDSNSRSSETSLGKAANISRERARYRIKKLEEEGIIKKYYLMLDVNKLGLTLNSYVYVQFGSVSKEEENVLITKILNENQVGWLVTCTGTWDLIFLLYSENAFHMNNFIQNNLVDLDIRSYETSLLISSEHIQYQFLNNNYLGSVSNSNNTDQIKLDEIDIMILKQLDQNARMPLTEISLKTEIPLHTVKYRKKQMEKDLIQGYKLQVNPSKMNYNWYLVCIKLYPGENQEKFIFSCSKHKAVYYCTHTIGLYNLMLDLHLETAQDLREVLGEIKSLGVNIIESIETITIFEELKISYVPF